MERSNTRRFFEIGEIDLATMRILQHFDFLSNPPLSDAIHSSMSSASSSVGASCCVGAIAWKKWVRASTSARYQNVQRSLQTHTHMRERRSLHHRTTRRQHQGLFQCLSSSHHTTFSRTSTSPSSSREPSTSCETCASTSRCGACRLCARVQSTPAGLHSTRTDASRVRL